MASPAPFLSKLWNQHALPLPTPTPSWKPGSSTHLSASSSRGGVP